MENVLNFLKSIGVEAETIESLKAESLPEDFDMENAVTSYNAKQKDLLLNNPNLQKELKKKYNSQLFPVIQKQHFKHLKNASGLTDEEITSLIEEGQEFADFDKVVSLAFQKAKQGSSQTVDEITAQLLDVKRQLGEGQETWANEKNNLLQGFEREKKSSQVKSLFHQITSNMDVTIERNAANDLLMLKLQNNYDFDVEDGKLTAKTKEGYKPQDGNNFLTATDLIKGTADALRILKKSNGGTDKPPTDAPPNGRRHAPPTNDAFAERVKARIEKAKQERGLE